MAKISIDKIRKQYGSGKGSIIVPREEQLWLPSRCLPINYLTGGGIPYGTILEEFGWESTGKSLLAADFACVAQSLGGVVLWDDAEFAFNDSAEYYSELGLDVEEVELLEDDTVEVYSDWVMDMTHYYRSQLVNNEPIVLICDSIAALECEEAQGAKQSGSKREMGNRAKAIYAFYRKRRKILKRLGICTIMINQVRDKVGANMFQESTTTPGGAATAFYASIRLALLKGKQIKLGDSKIGNHVHAYIKKNKVAPPRNKVQTEVHFLDDLAGYIGFNRYAGLAAIAKSNKLLKKTKGHYNINGIDLGKSMKNLDENIGGSKEVRKFLIDALDINTTSKARAKMESIDKNLFKAPVKKSKEDEE